jgi:hypothetical protein
MYGEQSKFPHILDDKRVTVAANKCDVIPGVTNVLERLPEKHIRVRPLPFDEQRTGANVYRNEA